jgi:hypothetical protein
MIPWDWATDFSDMGLKRKIAFLSLFVIGGLLAFLFQPPMAIMTVTLTQDGNTEIVGHYVLIESSFYDNLMVSIK